MKVLLSNNCSVEVLPVPPFALAVVASRFPGDDAATIATREQTQRETAWLIALPGLTVPDDWQFPDGLRYAGVEPRAGGAGRLLDYIEYGLLQTNNDILSVQTVMYAETVTEDEIGAAEAVFPDNG